jgi:hypothetical protein
MAPTDRFKLPLRWQFAPETARDGSIRWRWRAYSQTGDLAMQSETSFETLTDCMAEARLQGYGRE